MAERKIRRSASGAAAPISNNNNKGSNHVADVSEKHEKNAVSKSKIAASRRRKRFHLTQSSSTKVSTTTNNGAGGSSSSSYPLLLFVFAMTLVLADFIYLYRLSSQALMDDPKHTSTLKATYLSRVAGSGTSSIGGVGGNSTIFSPGVAKQQHIREGHVRVQKRPPPLPDDHQAMEEMHHQHQMEVQQKLYPPNQLPDMLQHQALDIGYHNLNDKGPILDILQQAGLLIQELDQETIDLLPTWSQVQQLYGTEPRIIGLETCAAFRDSVDPRIRFFGVAGTFNSGTNLVAELMSKNCQITERMEVFGNESKGIRWQVPWGKHYPASFRGQHGTRTDKDVPYQNSLPLVSIREPYMWLQSMCRHHYEMRWPHDESHCPNIIATEEEIRDFPWLSSLYLDPHNKTRERMEYLVPINIKFQDRRIIYKSLPHFWSEWYHLYLDADYPRIMVRFEDLLFYGKEVTEKLCECGGGVPRPDRPNNRFVHISESAKLGTRAHGNQKTNLLGAIIKYGKLDHRLKNMTDSDIQAARKYFDDEVMTIFGYHHPEAGDS
ncbi:hypothetical protein IV203_012975 [Nitzschia inconspicua]|uniref:Sulfotransferase domain-containing protein n=1 Tax=Nitzschia inconspicua TaxID=303405 RepID=A0A9K3M528_9STRA|nr:hypothetical protein IV203_012975 [Nitzschia inconspicua]